MQKTYFNFKGGNSPNLATFPSIPINFPYKRQWRVQDFPWGGGVDLVRGGTPESVTF